MTLEDWNMVLQLASAALLGFTFFVGAATIFVDRIISARQEARIASAQRDAAVANQAAGKLALQTEELKRQNLATEEKLEQERLARIEIEERVAFRRITEKRRLELASRLKSFSGQTVSLWFNAGDHEGAVFASDIASALMGAKWDVFAPASKMDFAASGRHRNAPIETGVIVVSTSQEASLKASEALVRELSALGFDVQKSATLDERPIALVFVNVESRPEGPQGEAKLRSKAKK